MKRTAILILLMLLTVPACVGANNSSPEERFKKSFPDRSFESITPTTIKGVYEVYTGNQLYYYAPEADTVIYGNIVTRDGNSLTRESYLKKMALKMAGLPLSSALKIGKGKNIIIEFMDPDCGHCRDAYKFFSKRNDVTINVFFYPLSQASEKKIRHILSARDPLQAYNDAMNGKLDNNAPLNTGKDKKTEETLKTHKGLASQIGIRSTPFFYIKGQAIDGFEAPIFENILKK